MLLDRGSSAPGRVWRALAFIPLFAACQRELPLDLGGTPLWFEPDMSSATDLGHSPVQNGDAAPASQPLVFSDRTEQVGLADAIGGGNTHGVGVAFVDLSGDGFPDIFVCNGRSGARVYPSKLYINRPDTTRFEDETTAWGLDILAEVDCYSVAAADLDRDGDIDLYLGAQSRDLLLRNDGDHFVDVTQAAGAGGPASDASLVSDGRSKVVGIADYDADGWLDIVSASSTLPEPWAYLLRNKGGLSFEDVTASVGMQANPIGNPCAVLFSDYDNDGDPDLWIWNDRGERILLENDAKRRFVDITETAGVNDEANVRHPMGIDGADMDHDGDLDYYIANIGTNPFLRNNGDGTFTNIQEEAGVGGEFGWGLALEDFDADGFADIFVAQEDDLPYLTFQNPGVDRERFIRAELDHPRVRNSGAAHNVAAAVADYDRDGRVDVVTANTDGTRITLFRNETDQTQRHWLQVAVGARPGGVPSEGVGARVLVKTGDLVQFRDINGGSSRASQTEHAARFGLADWDGAEWVIVQWPTGEQIVVTGVPADRRLELPAP